MEIIETRNTFKPITGEMPDLSLIHLPEPSTVAVSAMDIQHIRPKLMVRENDPVKTGTPLFHDKRRPEIQYVSPATGRVQKIVFGERRRLKEVVIQTQNKEEFVQFDPLDEHALDNEPLEEITIRLKQGGLWQCFRQLPANDTAQDQHMPPLIIVSLNGNDLFSPHPGIALKGMRHWLISGLKLLKRFSKRVIVITKENSLARLGDIREHVTHVTANTYPDWDPGVVLYKIKKDVSENSAWHISGEHLTLITRFLATGRYPVHRVVSVTRGNDKKPHILIRQGSPVADIIGSINKNAVITTGRFNGRKVDPESHMGFFETTLNVLKDQATEEMFGFIRPGLTTPTASKTYISAILGSHKQPDANLHGEERACINCGYCGRICPVELMPSFIMKSLFSDDIEEALSYGLWDCVRCGLCAYVCPSKIELTKTLSQGMDAYYKDKQ